jgi:hypothetical protein
MVFMVHREIQNRGKRISFYVAVAGITKHECKMQENLRSGNLNSGFPCI